MKPDRWKEAGRLMQVYSVKAHVATIQIPDINKAWNSNEKLTI
jgi:hypothetical protein